jgi:hypothetical protein
LYDKILFKDAGFTFSVNLGIVKTDGGGGSIDLQELLISSIWTDWDDHPSPNLEIQMRNDDSQSHTLRAFNKDEGSDSAAAPT